MSQSGGIAPGLNPARTDRVAARALLTPPPAGRPL